MKRFLKISALTLLGVILVILAAITVAVNYLRPEKLTPLVERIANDYLRAEVSIGKMEISFWSTFPRFDLEIDNLEVRTEAFDSLPSEVCDSLPIWCDSLLTLRHLSAAINIPRLLAGNIAIYDITLVSPAINLAQAATGEWSLDIFPSTAEEDGKEDRPLEIPDFSFGTFEITDGLAVRYISKPDSINIGITLTHSTFTGKGAPVYSLKTGGVTSASIPMLSIDSLKVGMGGNIGWSPRHPLRLSLDDFRLSAGNVETVIDTSLDFTDDLTVETFELKLPRTPVMSILALVPEGMSDAVNGFHPEFDVSLGLQLRRPFRTGIDSIPSFDLQVKIPEGKASYEGYKLDAFELQLDASIDGTDPDRSVVSVSRLFARGEGMGFSLSGNVTDPVSDPKIDGNFKGGLSFRHLPRIVRRMLPGDISGKLTADCDFTLRKSFLNKENFHRIKLTGKATLTGLDAEIPDMSTRVYAGKIDFRLGSNSTFVHELTKVDSLLTASLSIDTLSCSYETIDINGRGLRLSIGSRNIASSTDTTQINPFGGRLVAERLSMRDGADSTRISLRDASAGGALRRYKGNARLPQLSLKVTAGSAFYGDRLNRAMIRDAESSFTVYPSDTPSARRRRERIDSLRHLYPTLSRDSILVLYSESRRHRNRDSISARSDRERLEVDNSLRTILRQWDARGSLKARRASLFTPLFPLRNRITDLDIGFSTDSVHIHDTRVKVGRSDFLVDGHFSNISRALTSRNGSQSLMASLELLSDTIDVNEIAGALFTGAAFADSHAGTIYVASESDSDERELQSSVEKAVASADSASVLLIPANLEASFNVVARNIIYSDLKFRNFRGSLDAFDGALSLSQLGAASDMGEISLNALYTAPDKQEAAFAFDLSVKDFHVRQFLELVPAIDSLMPLLNDIDGVINADIAATTDLDSMMNIEIPTLKAAVKISGDSLVLMDEETFRTLGKWLLFKDKNHNMIDSMTVEMLVNDSRMQMFPFMFNIDRYKLGVMGHNDLAMNLNYHIAVLKSPIPFKFGINITGNPDKMKIRLGKAKFNEKTMPGSVAIADTTRINLVQEIRNAFSRGVTKSRIKASELIDTSRGLDAAAVGADIGSDTITHADSLYFINQGVLPAPPEPVPATDTSKSGSNKNSRKSKKK